MIATVVAALLVAGTARRIAWVRERLPPPAVIGVVAVSAAVVVVALRDAFDGVGGELLCGAATIGLSALGLLLAGVVRDRVIDPVRRRLAASTAPTVREWVLGRTDAVTWRVRGWSPVALAVRSVLRAGDVRVTGLAAEMSYYALISLVPITTALGASLGYLRTILGDQRVDDIRNSIIDFLTTIFAEQVASDVLAPLVDGLLSESQTGLAVGALVITLYLASRMFRAAVRALDDAYRVPTRRHVVAQYALGFAFTIGALVALVGIALLLFVGPLLGDGAELAERFGLGDVFTLAWDWLRWPVAFAAGGVFLVLLYRYAPNVRQTWTQCLPGAVVGAVGVLAVSACFRWYVGFVTPRGAEVDAVGDAVVQASAQMLSVVLAGVLWLWLVSIAVLAGGILNAEIDDERGASAPRQA